MCRWMTSISTPVTIKILKYMGGYLIAHLLDSGKSHLVMSFDLVDLLNKV
jgi:hypothetical protein